MECFSKAISCRRGSRLTRPQMTAEIKVPTLSAFGKMLSQGKM